MKKNLIGLVAVFLVFFIIVFFVKLFKQPEEAICISNEVTINPVIELTLKEVLLYNWGKNIIEISVIFEGGKIKRTSLRKNMLSHYRLDAKLKDIETTAKITFYQNEEFIKDKAQENISMRELIFITKSSNQQNKIV